MFLPAEVFWRIFEKTGSIRAYILYKKLIVQ
ncbi:YqzL family protein [Desulfitibacter alkalitolerans]